MIGFGGIGAVHKVAYDALLRMGAPIRLVAICDKNKDSIKAKSSTTLGEVDTGSFEEINFYTNCDELLEKEEFDAADICLPTFLHKDYAMKLLRAGKHVLCEKPMALNAEEAAIMKQVSEEYFFRSLVSLENTEEAETFFRIFCTDKETQLIAQRLYVAKMLSEQVVYSKIVEETGASTATISRVKLFVRFIMNPPVM